MKDSEFYKRLIGLVLREEASWDIDSLIASLPDTNSGAIYELCTKYDIDFVHEDMVSSGIDLFELLESIANARRKEEAEERREDYLTLTSLRESQLLV